MQAIKRLRSDGVSIRDVAYRVNVAKSTVQSVIKKNYATFQVKAGRKPLLSARQERKLVVESKRNPFLTANELRHSQNLQTTASVDTVKRILRKNGLFGRISARKPALTKRQIKKRKEFCIARRDWNTTDWSRIIFSDECPLYLGRNGRQYVRRVQNSRHRPSNCTGTVKFAKILMVWGAIRSDGKRILHRCEGNVDALQYQAILSQALPEIYRARNVLQQDGASCHRARSTSRFLRMRQVRILNDWPAQSPDLNIIENMWFFLQERLKKRVLNNLDELWEAAKEEWEAIPNDKVLDLYHSLPRRVEVIIRNRGKNSRY